MEQETVIAVIIFLIFFTFLVMTSYYQDKGSTRPYRHSFELMKELGKRYFLTPIFILFTFLWTILISILSIVIFALIFIFYLSFLRKKQT